MAHIETERAVPAGPGRTRRPSTGEDRAPDAGRGEPVLRTERLTKHYGAVIGLDNLDLEMYRGEVLGYLGPNGAGKTTTIRLLLGLIKPTAGRAMIFGLDAGADKVAVHAQVAYVPGEATLWPSLTGAETLHLLARVHGETDLRYRDELVRRFDFDPSRKVRTYSKGNRQKINLIAALASRAELLILDEPTAGLDPLMEQAFRQSVIEAKANGQAVFLSSHVLSEAEALCDRIAILRGGRLVEIGTLAQMRHLSALTRRGLVRRPAASRRRAARGERGDRDRPPAQLPGARPDRRPNGRPRRCAAQDAAEPRAVAGGAVLVHLRRAGARPRGPR
jgi:ABC-2 type transport system ATP-binding protein